jgi:hypothetical protein
MDARRQRGLIDVVLLTSLLTLATVSLISLLLWLAIGGD